MLHYSNNSLSSQILPEWKFQVINLTDRKNLLHINFKKGQEIQIQYFSTIHLQGERKTTLVSIKGICSQLNCKYIQIECKQENIYVYYSLPIDSNVIKSITLT